MVFSDVWEVRSRLLDQFSESQQMVGCDQDEFSGQKRVRTGTELSRQTLA